MSGASSAAGPLLSIGLRRGGELIVWSDRITSGAESYLLSDISELAIVSAPVTLDGDMTTPASAPALLFKLRDGRSPLFVPADREAVARVRAAIFTLVPALAGQRESSPAPSAAGAARSRGSAAAARGASDIPRRSTYANQATVADHLAPSDRALAGLAHLSVFYMPLLLPFILWIALRGGSPYAARQAKQAFFFHLLMLGIVALVVVPAWVILTLGGLTGTMAASSSHAHSAVPTLSILSLVCGGALLLVLSLALAASGVYAAIRAFLGKPFHYPFLRAL